jgi:hypothetical protein
MALSFAALEAYETTYYGLDRPILGVQAIPITPDLAKWHNGIAWTDRADPVYPARRGYDGFNGFWTQPTTVDPHSIWCYYLTTTTSPITFDFVAIINHNFGTLHAGGALTITLEVDNASDFPASHQIPLTVTTSESNSRIMVLDLHHTGAVPLRYSDVPYTRLKIARGSKDFTPRLGEIILGRRYQQKHRPRLPHDPTSLHGTSENTETMGGVIYVSTFAKGRRHLSASIRETDATQISNLNAWFRGCEYGTRPFVWIENPYTAPNSWHSMVLDAPDHDFPTQEFADRNLTIEATEQGPENCYLDRAVY